LALDYHREKKSELKRHLYFFSVDSIEILKMI